MGSGARIVGGWVAKPANGLVDWTVDTVRRYNPFQDVGPIRSANPGIYTPENGVALSQAGYQGHYLLAVGQLKEIRCEVQVGTGEAAKNAATDYLIGKTLGMVGGAFGRYGDDVTGALWRVGRHGDMPSPRPSMQSHHAISSKWMKANYSTYNKNDAPAILMPAVRHRETFGVFNRWRSEIARRQGVDIRSIDYALVSHGEIWSVAEAQFQAAQVPLGIREEYFRQFNVYLSSLR